MNITVCLDRLERKAAKLKTKDTGNTCTCKFKHYTLAYADPGEKVTVKPEICPNCGKPGIVLVFPKDCEGL